jgi:pimeloyl-ACP methyl ester carboxylesterase
MIAPKDRYLMVGKIRTRYWCEGEHGSPVLLLHGISGSIETWLPNLKALCAQHTVYAVDMIGHGRTDKPLDAGYTIHDLAQFVRDFMTAADIRRAHMIGHSLGGAVALRLTLHFPAVVERLILVSSAGLGKEVGMVFRLGSLPLLGEIMLKPTPILPEATKKLMVYDPAVLTPEKTQQDFEIQNLPGNLAAFFKIMRSNVNVFGQKESAYQPHLRGLGEIQKPTLVIWGRDDQLVPAAHADAAAKGLSNVQVHLFDACGHLPNLEVAAQFNQLIGKFLSDTILL